MLSFPDDDDNSTTTPPSPPPSNNNPFTRLLSFLTMTIHSIHDRYHTPTYRPSSHWDLTFAALGWTPPTVHKFWTVFCRINKSRSGTITLLEFLDYFNLDRSAYVEKCFSYFDTTGGDDVDFLEFMVSVWNICTLDATTLTNFTFDIYDLDGDGELTCPELERMVGELFGTTTGERSARGRECLRDLTRLAEERGGVISLRSFVSFTTNHSMLLFPVFQMQRTIQKKVLGLRYWEEVHRKSANKGGHATVKFDPRHVQILLRTYKTGSAAAILTHTGDPNEGLKEWFMREGLPLDELTSDRLGREKSKSHRGDSKSVWQQLASLFRENKSIKKCVDRFRTNHRRDPSSPVTKGEMGDGQRTESTKESGNYRVKDSGSFTTLNLPSVNSAKESSSSSSSSVHKNKNDHANQLLQRKKTREKSANDTTTTTTSNKHKKQLPAIQKSTEQHDKGIHDKRMSKATDINKTKRPNSRHEEKNKNHNKRSSSDTAAAVVNASDYSGNDDNNIKKGQRRMTGPPIPPPRIHASNNNNREKTTPKRDSRIDNDDDKPQKKKKSKQKKKRTTTTKSSRHRKAVHPSRTSVVVPSSSSSLPPVRVGARKFQDGM